MKRKDYSNQTFGYLKIYEYLGKGYYKAECSLCTEILNLRYDTFVKRGQISCGCHHNKFRIGDKLHLLTIKSKIGLLADNGKRKHNYIYWLCLCECGNQTKVSTPSLNNGHVKSCGCIISKFDRTRNIKNNTLIPTYLFNQIERGAKSRNIEFNISIDYIWFLFNIQNKKCSLSKLDLTFPKNAREKNYTASLDRIDSNIGYIEGNVQWVHRDINLMKNSLSQDYFIKMCSLICEENKKL